MKSLVIIIGLMFLLALFSGCIEIGEGKATDTIARVYESGLIWKTWKVQLTNDHPTADDEMLYGVEHNDELVARLQLFAEKGTRVKMYFRQELIVWPWEYSDNDIIYKVEEVQ